MPNFFFWPVTKPGTWDFRWNKFEVSSIYVWSHKYFWQIAPLQQHGLTMGWSGMVIMNTLLWYSSLWPLNHQWETLPSVFSGACSSAAVDRSTVGHWAKRVVMTSETGRVELHNLPCSDRSVIAVSPEILQHADAIVREDWRITTQQPAHSFSVSKGSISHIIQDLDFLRYT
jgi:hypothetical protein